MLLIYRGSCTSWVNIRRVDSEKMPLFLCNKFLKNDTQFINPIKNFSHFESNCFSSKSCVVVRHFLLNLEILLLHKRKILFLCLMVAAKFLTSVNQWNVYFEPWSVNKYKHFDAWSLKFSSTGFCLSLIWLQVTTGHFKAQEPFNNIWHFLLQVYWS